MLRVSRVFKLRDDSEKMASSVAVFESWDREIVAWLAWFGFSTEESIRD